MNFDFILKLKELADEQVALGKKPNYCILSNPTLEKLGLLYREIPDGLLILGGHDVKLIVIDTDEPIAIVGERKVGSY